ncbi:MAG: ribosomal protein S18-alanine N-acetyltransferase [Dethiobacter sp.]|nr:ribosomal protein S18-alanine N-acetyltransferase [Dethiobacter sp.]MCL5981278.1 ribosomal protein S18-alanine N-acetyltransferase [Bacillota bacterium]
MRPEHADQVVAIEREAFPSPWSRNAFLQEVLTNRLASYFVALTAGEVAGYAGFWVILDEAHITNLAVRSDCRRRGVGSALLEELLVEAACRGAVKITLEVRRSNLKAQNLYRQYGFIVCGVRPRYYNEEDALIMWLERLPSCRRAAAGQD